MSRAINPEAGEPSSTQAFEQSDRNPLVTELGGAEADGGRLRLLCALFLFLLLGHEQQVGGSAGAEEGGQAVDEPGEFRQPEGANRLVAFEELRRRIA